MRETAPCRVVRQYGRDLGEREREHEHEIEIELERPYALTLGVELTHTPTLTRIDRSTNLSR